FDSCFHCEKLIDSISLHLMSTLLAEPNLTATESPLSENSLHLKSLPPFNLIRIDSLSLEDELISDVSSAAITAKDFGAASFASVITRRSAPLESSRERVRPRRVLPFFNFIMKPG